MRKEAIDSLRVRVRDAGLLLVALLACGCGHTTPTTVYRLPSGRAVEVLFTGAVADGWILEYRTHLAMAPRADLQCEAEALREDVQKEAEAAGLTRAGIWPTNLARRLKFDGWYPVIISDTSTAFSLKRDETGVWRKSGGWTDDACGR